MEKNAGNQGLAIIVDPKSLEKQSEDKLNQLLLAKVSDNNIASHWAGFVGTRPARSPMPSRGRNMWMSSRRDCLANSSQRGGGEVIVASPVLE